MDSAALDDVLARARLREPAALERLVDLYSARVYGLLYRLTGSREAAEDLLQDTFLRVVRTIERYEHVGKFESWLFRIAANLARDRARQRDRRGASFPLGDADADAASAGPADPRPGPTDELGTGEARQRVFACLGRLSEAEREVLLLRYFSDLPFRDIAAILQVPLGTALARAHRALQRLKRELAVKDVV